MYIGFSYAAQCIKIVNIKQNNFSTEGCNALESFPCLYFRGPGY
jgi:hypothetical protein